MGRTVVLEDRLRAEFEQLVGTRQPHVGLLIGQVNAPNILSLILICVTPLIILICLQLTSSKDYVSLFVPTPALKDIKDGGKFTYLV